MGKMPAEPKLKEKLTCPVCGKLFIVTEDTKYMCKGNFSDDIAYTCSWKCFLDSIHKKESENNKEESTIESKKEINSIKLNKIDDDELFGILE